MRKAALHNLGCKVNAYETEAMQQLLEENGYEIVPFEEKADVYIVNTCSVTNMADRKSRQMLHRARKRNPQAVIVAAGCYVQTAAESLKETLAADILIGNNKKQELPEILAAYFEKADAGIKCQPDFESADRADTADKKTEQTAVSGQDGMPGQMSADDGAAAVPETAKTTGKMADADIFIEDISVEHSYENLGLTRTAEHTRAYIKVQDGCNQFCSYCIIPYARGRVRSRAMEDILSEVRTLAAAGYREVVLTGIHLSSYGIDFAKTNGEQDYLTGGAGRLLNLLEAVGQVPGIARIRLGSLEPRIITEDFVERLSRIPEICPHFHLSLQSGCDETLKRMNRHYTTEEYVAACALLRRYFHDPALTTDLIAGFPGETEEEFAQTLGFVEKVGFYETHVFKYSVRQGTRAATMKNQVPEEIKTKRSGKLLELSERKKKEYEDRFPGREVELLAEEEALCGDVRMMTGHTKEYLKVGVPMDEAVLNRVKNGDIVKGIVGKNVFFVE